MNNIFILFIVFSLNIFYISQATEDIPEVSKAYVQKDPLFPETLPTQENIRAGLKLVKEIGNNKVESLENRPLLSLTCNFDLPEDEDFSSEKKFFLGSGGSKQVLKLNEDSERVILVCTPEHSWKEYYAYHILNAFGFVSQQDPQMVIIDFRNNQRLPNVLSCLSFDSLTKNYKRRTWDTKNYKGFGQISIFHNRDNFTNIDYNVRLFSPLVRDYALWTYLGSPGDTTDSANLILQATVTQTLCRLFLYDIYMKGEENVFGKVTETIEKNTKEESCFPQKALYNLYTHLCMATLNEEKKILWGEEYARGGFHPRNKANLKEVAEIWGRIKSFLESEYDQEWKRLTVLFQEIFREM